MLHYLNRNRTVFSITYAIGCHSQSKKLSCISRKTTTSTEHLGIPIRARPEICRRGDGAFWVWAVRMRDLPYAFFDLGWSIMWGMHQNVNKLAECHICFKKFKHKYALKFHIKQVHEGSTKVQCPACLKLVYNNYSLKNIWLCILHQCFNYSPLCSFDC